MSYNKDHKDHKDHNDHKEGCKHYGKDKKKDCENDKKKDCGKKIIITNNNSQAQAQAQSQTLNFVIVVISDQVISFQSVPNTISDQLIQSSVNNIPSNGKVVTASGMWALNAQVNFTLSSGNANTQVVIKLYKNFGQPSETVLQQSLPLGVGSGQVILLAGANLVAGDIVSLGACLSGFVAGDSISLSIGNQSVIQGFLSL